MSPAGRSRNLWQVSFSENLCWPSVHLQGTSLFPLRPSRSLFVLLSRMSALGDWRCHRRPRKRLTGPVIWKLHRRKPAQPRVYMLTTPDPERQMKAPEKHFGRFTQEGLRDLAVRLGEDIDIFTVHRKEPPDAVPTEGRTGHCVVRKMGSDVAIVATFVLGFYYVLAILRFGVKVPSWTPDPSGQTVIDFLESLRPHLQPQTRSVVDYSDGRALLSYGWCYYLKGWSGGCRFKRSFFKDKRKGHCRPRPNPEMYALRSNGASVSPDDKSKFKTLVDEVAKESGNWIQHNFPETQEMKPTGIAESCLHTPHFTSFALSLDAKQFTHRHVQP